jgi:solute carrier family 24 (sodium/potassium/calcium exchanger), member 6
MSPSLQRIAKTFKLSESLAGVTLLAFGAGSPDIFASLSASEGADLQGIQLGLGVLLGSSLFILSIVTSSCILASPRDIKLNKNFFLRDTLFLLVGQVALLYATMVRGNIDMITSISFVAMYIVYVVVVFI